MGLSLGVYNIVLLGFSLNIACFNCSLCIAFSAHRDAFDRALLVLSKSDKRREASVRTHLHLPEACELELFLSISQSMLPTLESPTRVASGNRYRYRCDRFAKEREERLARKTDKNNSNYIQTATGAHQPLHPSHSGGSSIVMHRHCCWTNHFRFQNPVKTAH
jgi:hypothetical protein